MKLLSDILSNILTEESKKKKKEKKKKKYHYWDGFWLHQNIIDELLGGKEGSGSEGDMEAPAS